MEHNEEKFLELKNFLGRHGIGVTKVNVPVILVDGVAVPMMTRRAGDDFFGEILMELQTYNVDMLYVLSVSELTVVTQDDMVPVKRETIRMGWK